MKTCFKCKRTLPILDFYKHPQMSDGHLGKCKECTRRDTLAHRNENLETIRAYDRARAVLPHRKVCKHRVTKRWIKADKRRHRAHRIANRHHRKKPDACQMCGIEGKKIERHHPDYDLPMLIVWLCKPCHCIADKRRRAEWK